MRPSVTCYVVPGKTKSRLLCEAFAVGCGGLATESQRLLPGAAFFYGVAPATMGVWTAARAERREYYYADNSYFDATRQRYFRVTRNAFQVSAPVVPDHARLNASGVQVKPWQASGSHIVVVEQSDPFMHLAGHGAGWLAYVTAELAKHTDRPLRIRRWNRDKDKASRGLPFDLEGAWALVTHMSAAANEALLAGIPVFVTGPCAATPLASGPLSEIERPLRPDGREDWAAGLAGMQWTLDEIRQGMAWRTLQA